MVLLPFDERDDRRQETIIAARSHVVRAGFPVYPGFERGARAFGKATAYHRRRREQGVRLAPGEEPHYPASLL